MIILKNHFLKLIKYKQMWYYSNKCANILNIKHDCHSCLYRHSMCNHEIPEEECKYWQCGGCYSCEYFRLEKLYRWASTDIIGEDGLTWWLRGCESECNAGCGRWKLRKDIKELKEGAKND